MFSDMAETKESPFSFLFKSVLPFCKLCVALLVPSLVLSSFIGLGFYRILVTITFLVSSTILLLTLTNKRNVVDLEEKNPVFENLPESEAEEKLLQPVIETIVPESDSAAAQEADIVIVHEIQGESLGSTSDNESSSDDSESSSNPDQDWMIMEKQNPEISDDSVSEDEEEEGLIEIAIPGSAESEPRLVPNLQSSNLPTLLPESIFKQQDIVDFLAEINEVNEEENLIEIDISMGSIKCPRLEIEA